MAACPFRRKQNLGVIIGYILFRPKMGRFWANMAKLGFFAVLQVPKIAQIGQLKNDRFMFGFVQCLYSMKKKF